MAKRPEPVAESVRSMRPRSVADIVPDIGQTAFRKFGFIQSSVVSRWREIVGEKYAHASAPESIRFPHGKREDGVMTVVVTGAHAPMMQHVIPTMIERVNRFFGYAAVARVVIRQGTLPQAARRAAPLPSVPVPTDLGDSLRTVADPELRTVLESLARGVAAARNIPVVGKIS
ncbi:MAG: DciA family protein [Pseudomonadota bacterium]